MNRILASIVVFGHSVIWAQVASHDPIGPQPFHVALDTPQEWAEDCAKPIGRNATTPVGTGRLSAVCDKSCGGRKAEVDAELKNIMKIEQPNSCFVRFFAAQPPLDEPHGNTNEQIANDLILLPASLTLHFNKKLTIEVIGATACGGEDINHPSRIDTKKGCWASYGSSRTPGLRASYLAHETAHTIGYTHLCTNLKKQVNLKQGNELTVPYVTDAAIAFCWDEVINGGPKKTPTALAKSKP